MAEDIVTRPAQKRAAVALAKQAMYDLRIDPDLTNQQRVTGVLDAYQAQGQSRTETALMIREFGLARVEKAIGDHLEDKKKTIHRRLDDPAQNQLPTSKERELESLKTGRPPEGDA